MVSQVGFPQKLSAIATQTREVPAQRVRMLPSRTSTVPDSGNLCLSDQKPTDGCRTCDLFRVETFMIIFCQRLDSPLMAENESERAF
jgi:hypothetical protein